MAIASYTSDWSLPPCINCKNRIFKSKICYSCKTLPFLSNLCFNSKTLIVKSSSCSSPVLEEKSHKTNSQVLELDLELENYTSPPPTSTSTTTTTTTTCLPDSKELNGLICSLLKDPQTQAIGYDYYEKAKGNKDFRPEKSTLKLLIRYLLHSNRWGSIFSLSQDFTRFKVVPDSTTCCKMISSCIKARKFKVVNSLLQSIAKTADDDQELAVLAFDSAMKGYNKLHMYSSTVALYDRMRCGGPVLDPGCVCSTMEAYLKTGHSEKAVALFQDFESRKVGEPTPQMYRHLCESLGKLGRPFEALEYFRDMTNKGIVEDHSFYSILICGFANNREVKMAEELLEEAEGKKMLRDPALFLKLVLMYIEEGKMEKTLDAVAVMRRVNIKVSDCIFCAIVNGFAKKRGVVRAVEVYEELSSQEGCEPGQVTYASALNLYCRLGLLPEAERVFSKMEQKGFDKCVVAYSTMIAMYGKAGRAKDATKLVARMKERGCPPNVWVYNSLLDIYGKVVNLRQVEKTWKEMKRRKILPDRVSYTSIISAYSRAREFDKCLEYYKEFTLNGGRIDRAMAGIMVAVLSKMNRIDELMGLLQNMKREGTKLDGRLLRSAFNALRDAGLQIQAKWLQESFGAT